jgi:hypothetical protein
MTGSSALPVYSNPKRFFAPRCSARAAIRPLVPPFSPFTSKLSSIPLVNSIFQVVGRRYIRMNKPPMQGWREIPVLLVICLPVAGIVVGTIAVHNASSQPDLSELAVKPGSQIVDWSNLSSTTQNRRVRLLGYMMDTSTVIPTGEKVPEFVLMPEAGTAIHPAHREPNAMISVQLRHGTVTEFKHRQLVWAEGLLSPSACSDCDGEPAHVLREAQVSPAITSDIRKFFAAR